MPAQPTRRDIISGDNWYPLPETYWVPEGHPDERPFRYGDLFAVPSVDTAGTALTDKAGQPWHAVMALSPSCELVSKAKPTDAVEVARVYPLGSQDDKTQAAISAGWQERDGRIGVAFTHTIFLAPVPAHPTHGEPMFAHLKNTTRVTFSSLQQAGRIAALDHDARVHIIRREIYYRYRWLIPTETVRANEAMRMSNDPYFTEPRPPWGEFAPEDD